MNDLQEQIFVALGRVSMCWSEVPRGVFDSETARRIGEELLAAIQEHEQAAIEQAKAAWGLQHPYIVRDKDGNEIARTRGL